MSTNGADYVAMAPVYASAVRHVCYHSFASLTFLTWDSLVSLEDEIKYIWTMRNKSPFKWGYFFLRYGVILAHVTHNVLAEKLANGSNPPTLCRMWYTYVVVFTQIVQTLLELVLASRVFALYNRSKRIAFILLVLILVEIVGSARLLWNRHESGYYGTCLLLLLPQTGVEQSIIEFCVHCTLLVLTILKYFVALRAGWGRSPLVSLVVRDNSTVYIFIILLFTSVILLCDLENEGGVTIFFWGTAVMSISAARMILSMERFARKARLIFPSEAFFTTQFTIESLTSNLELRGADSNP